MALHSEGIKMTLASERPHLLAVDNDAFGGGIVIYHLEVRVCMCVCSKTYNNYDSMFLFLEIRGMCNNNVSVCMRYFKTCLQTCLLVNL